VVILGAMNLRTGRLCIRELTAADAPFILALLNEPSFIQNIGDRGVRNIPDAEGYILRGPRASYVQHGFGLCLVTLADDGTPIGMCGILKRDALPDPDIGFAFRPPYWSRGYAFEAASAVRDFSRDTLALPRLLAIVSPGNASSIRLLERLGFAFERMIAMPGDADELKLFAARL
jgi:ribosomal-protein-alanine N-acetyltransferase